MSYRISVDTGGTFTDVVVSDGTGASVIGKALTTPQRAFEGLSAAIRVAAESMEISFDTLLAQTDVLIYGTTRATNAIVEGKIAKTAFLATQGFADILLYREGGRIGVHEFTRDFPRPYIPRNRTYEVRERIDAEGAVVTPLDETELRGVIRQLATLSYEAVAVCLLWSVSNPRHEVRVGELLTEMLPGVPFTLSHQLLPIMREYRRASATAIDASLKPLMQEHLNGMERELRASGFKGQLLVSTSIGGCLEAGAVAARPIHTVKSGPAMAPVAGRVYSTAEEYGGDVIVCDTGGTTFDVGLVRGGEVVHSRDTWLGAMYTGHLIATSSVDVRSIGAGGGSIAWIDSGGLLKVGPHSAGAVPGPACYGRGGTDATVTDAALVLGYLDPANFLGGRMKLDQAAAHRAVTAIGEKLGQTTTAAAWAIMKVADELMIGAIHDITVAEGFNPQESAIVAGGGAAGLNALSIARELGIGRVILPSAAAALSASGMQYADIVTEESASRITRTNDFDFAGVNRLLDELRERQQAIVASFKGAFRDAKLSYYLEARYVGQVWELTVALPMSHFEGAQDIAALIEAFHQTHERVYAVRDPFGVIECLNWRVRAAVDIARPLPTRATATAYTPQPQRRRPCHFGPDGTVDTPIFDAAALEPGAVIAGPAIIEEPTTTAVIYPGDSAAVSASRNYLLKPTTGSAHQ
jgi:N-methylhydantoinase A